MPQEDHYGGEETLDLPTPTSATKRATVLSAWAAMRQMGRDQFDVVLVRQMLIEPIAVVDRVEELPKFNGAIAAMKFRSRGSPS
jgi:hypothetical protein